MLDFAHLPEGDNSISFKQWSQSWGFHPDFTDIFCLINRSVLYCWDGNECYREHPLTWEWLQTWRKRARQGRGRAGPSPTTSRTARACSLFIVIEKLFWTPGWQREERSQGVWSALCQAREGKACLFSLTLVWCPLGLWTIWMNLWKFLGCSDFVTNMRTYKSEGWPREKQASMPSIQKIIIWLWEMFVDLVNWRMSKTGPR